jgi:tetratricopeptide (TPR) repeat protein
MYRIAAELDPNSAPAQSNLVAFEYAQYRPDLTLQHALRGRELDPFDFGLHVKVISGLMQLGRVDELPAAVAWLNAIFGDEPSAARWGCLSRRTDGSYDAELACLLLALRRFPESDELIRQVADTCWELGDTVCASAWLEPPAAGGDESAVLYSMVDRRDVAGIRKVLQEALQEPIDYARGSLLTEVGFAVGLDDEALRIFEAAGIERATRDTAVLRRNAMVLLAQATVVRRGRGLEPSSGQQLDALLEWSGRPLAHGGRHYDFHLVRAEVLTAAGRIDEALAEIEAAGTAAEAPFEVRQVTDRPMGRFLARDPRLEPILQTIRDRQAAVRARVASTLKAEGIDPAELAAPPGAAALSVATGAQQK